MKTTTATALARNLSEVLGQLIQDGEEVVIERDHRQVARLVPAPARQTALEAMSGLYRAISEQDAAGWKADARRGRWKGVRLHQGSRDPWLS